MKKFRVAEIFGPTIQGEGRQAGMPCYFIRFGGCDYRCVWCDTPHAVLPDQVAQLEKMTAQEIFEALCALPDGPTWVVLTGGNPALLDLSQLVENLQYYNYGVMVETQGSIWNDWIARANEICISPKPPSSRYVTPVHVLNEFLEKARAFCPDDKGDQYRWLSRHVYLKVVVFDEVDYLYAVDIHKKFPYLDFYVSAGTLDPGMPTVGSPNPAVPASPHWARSNVAKRYKWLCEMVANDQHMDDVRVLPQLHVIAWGTERGH